MDPDYWDNLYKMFLLFCQCNGAILFIKAIVNLDPIQILGTLGGRLDYILDEMQVHYRAPCTRSVNK